MIALHSSAVDALHRQEQERKAREDRMRNALEIIATTPPAALGDVLRFPLFAQRVAREGLGRGEE